MCDYCEGKKAFECEYVGKGILSRKKNLDWLSKVDGDDGIAHIKDGILFADTSGEEYPELGFKINFCPMCGKEMDQKRVEDNEKTWLKDMKEQVERFLIKWFLKRKMEREE